MPAESVDIAREPARNKGLLRFMTCGSVDDGKSTLIGRLLYDAGQVLDDQLKSLEQDSKAFGTSGADVDFALLMDGLEAEREQNITIDVGYRYFSTGARSFIVADAPGHEQFTRNMATGASNCELAVILVDARKGVVVQTRRHAMICSLLGIRHVVLAINKMDLINYDQGAFDRIVAEFKSLTARLSFQSATPIPVSARFGDNVNVPSRRMPWYGGPTLLSFLETIEVDADVRDLPFRFPVQWVNRPNADFRGVSGTIASGSIRRGERIAVVGRDTSSTVSRIVTADGDLDVAIAGDAVTLTLSDELDVARGDLLACPDRMPEVADQFAAHVLWMSNEPLLPGRSYLMRLGSRWVPTTVSMIKHKLDVNHFEPLAARSLALNEIGFRNLSATTPLGFDAYTDNRATGAFILVDRYNNQTVAAGMIVFALHRATNIHREQLAVDKSARARLKNQRPCILWFTGLSASGKSTIAKVVEARLHAAGYHTYMLDGDNVRHGLTRDLGFTDVDRVENIRRVGEVAKLFVDAGVITICAFISPFMAERQFVRDLVEPDEFIEIFVDTPIEECQRRDPKGLYEKARSGAIKNFTGIDSAYEIPPRAELVLPTQQDTAERLAERVTDYLRASGHIT
jgi:bifunctional enzyme CysN/CysC